MAFFLVSKRFVPLVSFCASILAMLVSGSIYAWGVYSEALRERLGFTMTELNWIPSFANVGLYFGGVIVGFTYPIIGEFWSAIISIICCCFGYLMVLLSYNLTISSHFMSIAIYMLICGLGAAYGYISPLIAIVFNADPAHKGLLVGSLLSCLGISGFILNQFGNNVFTGDTESFFIFLICLCGFAFLISALFVRRKPQENPKSESSPTPETSTDIYVSSNSTENIPKPLKSLVKIQQKSIAKNIPIHSRHVLETSRHHWYPASMVDVMTWDYLILYILFFSLSGSGLMYIDAVTPMARAVTDVSSGKTDLEIEDDYKSTKSLGMSLLSIFNCLGRILIGIVSDLTRKRFGLGRGVWIMIVCITMSIGHLIPLLSSSQSAYYATTVIIGFSYGSSFCIISSFLTEIYPKERYSLNYGILCTSTCFGSFVYNGIFGAVYDSHSSIVQEKHICYGKSCYATAFILTCVMCFVTSFGLSIYVFIKDLKRRISPEKVLEDFKKEKAEIIERVNASKAHFKQRERQNKGTDNDATLENGTTIIISSEMFTNTAITFNSNQINDKEKNNTDEKKGNIHHDDNEESSDGILSDAGEDYSAS